MDGRDAARVRELDARPHRVHPLLVRRQRRTSRGSARPTPRGGRRSARRPRPSRRRRPGRAGRRSPRARPAELSQSEWPSFAWSATGMSPVTASSAWRVGSHLRMPLAAAPAGAAEPAPGRRVPRTASATRASASSSDAAPSSRTWRCASDHWAKWTCESVNPGRTVQPAEVDDLGARERRLVRPDAADDPVARDRERARRRQRRVHRADRGRSRGSRCDNSTSVIPARRDRSAPRPASRPRSARPELDAALVVQETDLVYLAGTGQSAHLVVPAEGEPALLVRKTLERAREESPLARVEPLRSLRELPAALASCGVDGRAARPRAGRAPGRVVPPLRASARRLRARRLLGRAAPGAGGQVRVGARADPRARRRCSRTSPSGWRATPARA